MHDGRVIWVVVPAYDEERLITKTLAAMPAFVDHIVVVDDASTDGTVARVRACGDARVTLIARKENGGVGAAIVDGYRTFVAGGRDPRDACVVMAGDAQMDPADLRRLLDALASNCGYAKGNRFRMPGVYRAMPVTRVIGNHVLTLLTRIATGLWNVGDSQCGYTAATRAALSALDLGSLYPRYGFPNDVLIRLAAAGIEVRDVPVRAIYGDEVSGINPIVVIPRILRILWSGSRLVRRARRSPPRPPRQVVGSEADLPASASVRAQSPDR